MLSQPLKIYQVYKEVKNQYPHQRDSNQNQEPESNIQVPSSVPQTICSAVTGNKVGNGVPKPNLTFYLGQKVSYLNISYVFPVQESDMVVSNRNTQFFADFPNI